MKFLNGELVQCDDGVAFLTDKVVMRVGDRIDVLYKGPDHSRFNQIGHVVITSMTFDPPELRYGHHIGAVDFAIKDDETLRPSQLTGIIP